MLSVDALTYRWPAVQKLPTVLFDLATASGYQPLNQRIVRQYRQPTGWLGRLIGHAMSLEHRPLTRWTLDLMHIHPEDQVLDVGCGAGLAVQWLAARAPHGHVTGIDYSPTMVQQALRRNHVAIQTGHVAIRQAEVTQLPFTANTFDQVCTIETLYFWPDPLAGLSEIWRVLKPGGRLAIALEYSKESAKRDQIAILARQTNVLVYSGVELRELLDHAGFQQLEYHAVPAKDWVYVAGTKGD